MPVAAAHTPAERVQRRRLNVLRAYLEGFRHFEAEAVAQGHVEVVETSLELARQKDALTEALRDQQRTVARSLARGGSARFDPDAPEVLAPLNALYELGLASAVEECASMGVEVDAPARFATVDRGEHFVEFRGRLDRVEQRMRQQVEAFPFDLAEETAEARLLRVPGVRDAASRITSPAYTAGLADVYADNEDAFGGWAYTGVFDRATCSNCGPLDGTTYATLEEMYRVLPNFGPNPSCAGGTRCRCRGVPQPPPPGGVPGADLEDDSPEAVFRREAAAMRADLAEEFKQVELERKVRQLGQRVDDEIQRRMVGRKVRSEGPTLKEAKADYEEHYRSMAARQRELNDLRRQRVPEVSYSDDVDGAREWWRQADVELQADPEYLRLKAIADEKRDAYEAAKKASRNKVSAETAARREVVDEVLGELRDFGGGEWTVVTDTMKAKIEAEAKRFPTEWRDKLDYIGVDVGPASARAFYSHGDRMMMLAKGEKASVILHELAHQVEYVVPRLSTVTKQFLRRRYNGREIRHLGGTYRLDEVGVPDEFNDRYVGKWYDGKATEVLTMGVEGVWHGRHKFWTGRDSEWRHLILGMLAGL